MFCCMYIVFLSLRDFIWRLMSCMSSGEREGGRGGGGREGGRERAREQENKRKGEAKALCLH